MSGILPHDDQCTPLGVVLYRLHKSGGYTIPDSFETINRMVSEGKLEYRLDDELECVMVSRPLRRN